MGASFTPPSNTRNVSAVFISFLRRKGFLSDICQYWKRHGECKHGADCKFSHPESKDEPDERELFVQSGIWMRKPLACSMTCPKKRRKVQWNTLTPVLTPG